MNDLESAAARFKADTSLPNRLAGECRRISGIARQRHPLGYQTIDAELAAGLAGASQHPPGAVQLLAVEKLHRAMTERLAEADAEIGRQAALHDAAAAQSRLEIAAGGCIGHAHPDGAFLHAARVCRDRLDGLKRNEASEATFAETLNDAENAIKAMHSALGLARRASRLRLSAEAAKVAVACLAAA